MPQNDAHQWRKLQDLFQELADAPTSVRRSRLAEVHADDAALAEELRALLEADAVAGAASRDNAGSGGGAGSASMTGAVAGAVQKLVAEMDAEDAERTAPAWIGEYRITGTLGSGGMGVVYLAGQQSPRRTVALKVIRAFGGANAVRRFQREAQLHGRLQHPGIALVHEAGIASERDATGAECGPPRPFFAMEYVHGLPVNEYAERHQLNTEERMELLARICDAVEHAHSRGVIHRDLKPGNVLVDESGSPKVLDFGVARTTEAEGATTVTAAGQVIGTLPYMSPEQVSGAADATPQSDIYALGVMLFELLSGRRPLDVSGRTLPEAVRIVTHDEPTRLGTLNRSLRGDLDTIASRCLEKDPARRYASAGALASDLRRSLHHQPIEARPASTMYQLAKFTRRHRPLVIGTATAFVALIIATAVSAVMAVKAETARADLAEQLRQTQIQAKRSQQSYSFLSNLITAADPTLGNGHAGEMTVHQMVLRGVKALENTSEEDGQVSGQLAGLIGYALWRLGDLEQAETAMLRSVELLKRSDFGEWQKDLQYATGLNILGDIYATRGKHPEAMETLRGLVALREAAVGKDGRDAHLAIALNSLGVELLALGQMEEAQQTLTRAYEMEKALVAGGLPRETALATMLCNKCKADLQMGAVQEAIKGSREAADLMEKFAGGNQFFTDNLRINLAWALIEAGSAADVAEAVQLTEAALARRKAQLPEGHHEISQCEIALAQALLATPADNGRRAVQLAQAASQNLERVLGSRNPNTWRAWLVLAGAFFRAGQLDEAEATARHLFAELKTAFPKGHYRMADAMNVRSAIARARGQHEESAELAAQALSIAERTVGPNHVSTITARKEREAATNAMDAK